MASQGIRPTLIPRWVLPAAVACVLAIGGLAGFLIYASGADLVKVPAVTGLEGPVARSRLAQAGLLLEYGDTRFSAHDAPGTVLEQDPPAGEEVQPGTIVVVVVSGGAEEFAMPDLVGLDIADARRELLGRSVEVVVKSVVSDAAQNTVVETRPAPGVTVNTGETITLIVSGGLTGDVLLPRDLSGVRVLLDPTPVTTSTADVPMEIVRRLRALLEASGAEVLQTRSILETQSPEAVRASWAAETSATVAVGISLTGETTGVRLIRTVPSTPTNPAAYLQSVALARASADSLAGAGERVRIAVPFADPVLVAAASPAVSVLLGDPSSQGNQEVFADARWAEEIARALYVAIADTFSSG